MTGTRIAIHAMEPRWMRAAIDAGINFLDNAWEYHDGEVGREQHGFPSQEEVAL